MYGRHRYQFEFKNDTRFISLTVSQRFRLMRNGFQLIRSYGNDTRITGLVDKFNWFIVPVANPDGYIYSFEKDRFWRKTRSRNITVNKWCVGVDANRNWGGKGWGEIGATRSPCSNIYAGSVPFSEPEVAALKRFIETDVQDLKIYISLHSYGQLFLSPWGYTSDKPDNHDDQMRAAELAVEAIKNESGRVYQHGTIAEMMCKDILILIIQRIPFALLFSILKDFKIIKF